MPREAELEQHAGRLAGFVALRDQEGALCHEQAVQEAGQGDSAVDRHEDGQLVFVSRVLARQEVRRSCERCPALTRPRTTCTLLRAVLPPPRST